MQLDEQEGHAGEGSEGEDGDGVASFAADVDVALGCVVCYCEGLMVDVLVGGLLSLGIYNGGLYVRWRCLSMLAVAGGGLRCRRRGREPRRLCRAIYGVYCEEADEGCLGGVMDKPGRERISR